MGLSIGKPRSQRGTPRPGFPVSRSCWPKFVIYDNFVPTTRREWTCLKEPVVNPGLVPIQVVDVTNPVVDKTTMKGKSLDGPTRREGVTRPWHLGRTEKKLNTVHSVVDTQGVWMDLTLYDGSQVRISRTVRHDNETKRSAEDSG